MGRDGVRLQRDREQLLPHMEPKNGSRGGKQERRFNQNTTKSASRASRRLSPLQDFESPTYNFGDDMLDDNYISRDDMLRDVQNYTSALDFGVDTPAGTVEFILPQQASPGVTSPWRALPAGNSPGGVTPEGSSPLPAPAPAPGPAPAPASAASRTTNEYANLGTVGVTPAVTHSRAASLSPEPVATRYGGGCNNNRATLAELFEAGTLQRLSELKLGPPCYTEDIARQAENASFNIEYAYVATNALGSFSRGKQGKSTEHLKGGDDSLTRGALDGSFRQGDRESGKAWRLRAGTHHFSSERTKSRRHPLGTQDQGKRRIQWPTGHAGVVTSSRDRLQ